MHPHFNREHSRTSFVELNTHQCKACWACLSECPNQVIGKVDLPWHKHILFVNPSACVGCLKCVKVCPHGACSAMKKADRAQDRKSGSFFMRFLVNNLLFLSSVATIISGTILQIGFHAGGTHGGRSGIHGVHNQSGSYENVRAIDPDKVVMGFGYSDWSLIHKVSIVAFSLLMIYHFCSHWRWYKSFALGHLPGKGTSLVILSVLFILVAVTGFVPWIIDLTGGSAMARMAFIEIHDKITLFLGIFLFIHFLRKQEWFQLAFEKLIHKI